MQDQPVECRVLYRDPRFFAAFPSVTATAEGTLLLAFRRARDHRWLHDAADAGLDQVDHLDSRSSIVLLTLDADGQVAGEPVTVPPDAQAADQDASLLRLRDGRLLLAGFCWYPVPAGHGEALRAAGRPLVGSPQRTGDLYLFWGGYTRTSDDGGRTWSPHRFLPGLPGYADILPGRRPLHGGAVRGRAVEAPDGTLLLTGYAHAPQTGCYVSTLFASADRGESWQVRSTVATDAAGKAGFCESALCLTAAGTLVAFHRTTGLDDRLATSRSGDLGRSWEPWQVHDVVGHPYDACTLADGRILLTYGYRHRPFGIRARLLDPEAANPAAAAEIVLRSDGPAPDLGYPWAVPLPDGRVLVAHYIADAAGVRGIEACLFRPA